MLRAICVCIAALLVLGACTSASETPALPDVTPSTPAASAPTPGQTAAPTPTLGAATPVTTSLVIWLGDDVMPATAIQPMQALSAAIETYQATNPMTRASLVTKKASGKGGIEDLLLTTQAALPQALPDIVTLDLRDLQRYSKEGLLQPFDGTLASAVQADLYSFARQAGVVDARQYAMPFTADVLQAAYDTNALHSGPVTWTDLYTNGIKYAFGAGEAGQASDSLLAQYVALGGHFADARGRPTLDRLPLRDALEFYRNTVTQSVAVSNTLSVKTLDDSLRMLTTGRASVADVSARTYMRELRQSRYVSYASIPTRDGNLVTISHTWGFALAAADPLRRAQAQKLIEYLGGPEITAGWNRAAGQLPVRRAALGLWSSDIAYRDFVNQLLSVAVNRPPTSSGASIDSVMQIALVDVLANGVSPADAADKAIAALNR